MMPSIRPPAPPPPTPSRADASVVTAGMRREPAGMSLITNSMTGQMQRRAQTGKTLKTGGTS